MLVMRTHWIVAAVLAAAAMGQSATQAQSEKRTEPQRATTAGLPKPEATDKAVELRRFPAHTDWVWTVALTPDGKTLVSAGGEKDHMARSWDFDTGKQLQQIDVRGSAQSLVVFPDGRRAAVASADKTIAIWDVQSGKELHRLPRIRARSSPWL